jgi:hypothetical protein
MPIISAFFGIAIRMFFDDPPPPHFHASYQEFEALVAIETGEVVAGSLPRKPARVVRRWALDRRAELMANWQRGADLEAMEMIPGADVYD